MVVALRSSTATADPAKAVYEPLDGFETHRGVTAAVAAGYQRATHDARAGASFALTRARRERPGPEHALSISVAVRGGEGVVLLVLVGYQYLQDRRC